MSEERALPFNEDFQQALIGHCLETPRFAAKAYAKLEPQWFTKNPLLGVLFSQLKQFHEREGGHITSVEEFKNLHFFLDQKEDMKQKYYFLMNLCIAGGRNFALDRLEKQLTGFLRVSMFKESVEGAAKKYKSQGFEEAFEWTNKKLLAIKDATFIDNRDILTFDNPEIWINKQQARREKSIPTGMANLDSALGGGLFKKEACAIMAPSNVGKCLGKDTPVIMFDGSVKMSQDIRTGDLLMGPDSKPRTVLGTTKGRSKLYRINAPSGLSWVCNDVHVLSLKNIKDGRGQITNIPIEEYIKKDRDFKSANPMWRAAVKFPHKNLSDPYGYGFSLGESIDKAYRTGSIDERLAFMAGIIDAYGSIRQTTMDIKCHDRVAEDVAFIARSLGFRAIVKKSKIQIRGDFSRLPIKNPKLFVTTCRWKDATHARAVQFEIEDIGVGDYYGFELDGDHLFLLGDFTVTHNTTTFVTIARHAIKQSSNVLFMIHEGDPEEIRFRILCAFAGIKMQTAFEMIKDPQGRRIIQALTKHINNHLTFVPYIRTGGMYVEDVMDLIKKLHQERIDNTGKGYDLLISDYPKKLRSRYRGGSKEGLYRVEAAEVYDNFNHVAVELDLHSLVAIQTNRNGLKQNNNKVEADALLGMEEIDEAFGIAQNMPNIITLNRSPEDRHNNIMRINVAKSRNGPTDIAINTRTNYDCYLTFGDKRMFTGGIWSLDLTHGYLASYLQKDNRKESTDTVNAALMEIESIPTTDSVGVVSLSGKIDT